MTRSATDFDLYDFLSSIRKAGAPYSKGLEIAMNYISENGGQIEHQNDGPTEITVLNIDGDSANCFQPYPDIDRFYFEM